VDGRGHGGVTPLDEGDEASFQVRPLQENVPSAGLAAQPDVGAQPVDPPCVAAARMGATQADDVAEQQG
jgi:hypothetical protein